MTDPCPTCGARLNVLVRSRRFLWLVVHRTFLVALSFLSTSLVLHGLRGSGLQLELVTLVAALWLIPGATALGPLLMATGLTLLEGEYRCCPRCGFLEIDGTERGEAKPRWRSTLSFYRHACLWTGLSFPVLAVLALLRARARPGPRAALDFLVLAAVGIAWLVLRFAKGALRKALDERRPARGTRVV